MKKILTLSLFLSFSYLATAQFDISNVRLGIQVSPTISWMNTNDNQITSDGNRVGLNLGIMGEYFFAENYSLVSGVSLLSGQGGGLNYTTYSGNFLPNSAADRRTTSPNATQFDTLPAGSTVNFGIQFIEIPFSVRLRTNEFGHLRYFAELPVFALGFKTQARADLTYPDETEPFLTSENIISDITSVNFKWGLGAGAEYNISDNLSIVGGIFYNSTLIDVTQDSGTRIFDSGVEEDSKATIHSITIRIGAMF